MAREAEWHVEELGVQRCEQKASQEGRQQGEVVKTGINVVSHRETQEETGPEGDVHAVGKNKAEPTPHGPTF